MNDSFRIIDDILYQGVQGISDLITTPGLINIDFADVKTIIQGSGTAMMGTGVASGEDRASEAASAAINSKLLDMSIDGAKGILLNIMAGQDISMSEIREASRIVQEAADPSANIIVGTSLDDKYSGQIRMTIVATGFDKADTKSTSGKFTSYTDFASAASGPSPFAKNPKQGQQQNPFQQDFMEPPLQRPLGGMPPQQGSQGTAKQQNVPNINTPPGYFGGADGDDGDDDIPAYLRDKR